MSADTVDTSSSQPAPQEAEAEMDMGALLESEAAQPSQLRRGEIVEGVVMGASADGMIVDVGIKTEAVIPQGEMLSLGVDGSNKLVSGDTVKVMVLQPSSAEGHAIVSLDRARGEEGWDVLAERFESGEVFDAQVTGHNRGGILVNVEGVNAFVPLSQIDSIRRDDPDAANALANLAGQDIRLKVLELNRKRNRVILSERAAMAEWRKEQKDRIIDELQEGEIRDGKVSSITDFGIFIDLGGADGLAHMTELTWERGKKPKDLYAIGDTVQAYILKVDREAKKISLSLKRAQPEQWDDTVDRYVIGQILIGRVTKIMAFGAFVRLEGPVEGLIHISELSNRRIQTPKDVVKEGDVVPVKLVRIEKDRHRLGLSLRQARNDAEAMGFAFDHDGRVIDYPDDVRAEYDLPAPTEEQVARQQQQPRNASEAIEQAVARDHEPVSAMAHAFAQAFEIAGDSPTEETPEAPAAVEEPAEQAVAEVEIATEPVAETLSEEAAAETEDSVPETENKVDAGETPAPATEDTTEADGADNADPVGEDKPDDA
ncbi:MAG: S1 RNA-binding domain-containing protein [Dehalococcoidia bacterium]|nr:S1 RNA-binding domain-containing protein [Dehalococcoidia bacterium]MCA9824782.1 S1 RNA-binding domain-containing protein [Dehalococcoidia bacterium]MCA9844726.1 S1 RNA-binding domain-containing protein [Dehalococcoidia bacterium]